MKDRKREGERKKERQADRQTDKHYGGRENEYEQMYW